MFMLLAVNTPIFINISFHFLHHHLFLITITTIANIATRETATAAITILVVINGSSKGVFPGSVSPGSEGLFVSLLPDPGSFVPCHCYFRQY